MPVYETPAPIVADINVSAAHVELVASDRDTTTVEITPTTPGRSGDVALLREATVAFEDNRLRVRVPPRNKLFGPNGSVDVRIELPAGSRAEIESAYGSVRVQGELGAARIVAKYGNVTADRVGYLELKAPYGEADIADVDGELEVTAGHGQVRIGRVAGAARIRGSHGAVTLGRAEGDVEVATSGKFTIEQALGDVTARSAHGAIRVLDADGGILRLENAHAEIEVGVALGVAAWVDAASAHGAVRNELTPGPEASDTDRTVQLHLRSDYGDVLIRRALRRDA
jgi:Putative adhesin